MAWPGPGSDEVCLCLYCLIVSKYYQNTRIHLVLCCVMVESKVLCGSSDPGLTSICAWSRESGQAVTVERSGEELDLGQVNRRGLWQKKE